ncbi:NUDIX domain-containing protein [Streptomyces sp. NPDC019531]|uniref:NUDIX domain-containing protein n=1 Tax=Streptomyces sp. NPDC019531 TaxID=3365062 RepID=UPI0038512D5B
MAHGGGVPEKVAWVLVRDERVLVTRSHGRDRFYFPGGHREPGESDSETLVREIDEELRAVIDPGLGRRRDGLRRAVRGRAAHLMPRPAQHETKKSVRQIRP